MQPADRGARVLLFRTSNHTFLYPLMNIVRLLTVFLFLAPSLYAQEVGHQAPNFALPWAAKDTISAEPITLSQLVADGPVLLAFYPADWSGGCTTEMCRFRDDFSRLADLGITVYGISGDYPYSHRAWADHHQFPFALLSDHRHDVSRSFGVFNEESGYTRRSVFLIGSDGVVHYVDLSFKAGDDTSYRNLYEAVRKFR